VTEEQNIITSLVELTRLRDQDAIRNKLLSSLLEISEAAWLVLCRLDQHDQNAAIEIRQRIPNPASEKAARHFPACLFERTEHFLHCLRSGNPVWVQDLEIYESIVFPMPDTAHHHEFVVLFDERVSGRSERIVRSVLDLYDNFIGLVIENTQDPLTRLLNRGAFDIDLPATLLRFNEQQEQAGKAEQKESFLAMMDLDRFKRINDTFGHLYGDEVILIFSSLLREVLGEVARLYRYGGEEFTAIVESVTRDEMSRLLERLRQAVEAHDFPQVGQVTVSIGVTALKTNHLPSSLLDHADQALYRAKESGRNRVIWHEDETPQRPGAQAADLDEDIFF
jgi:diguanylate cyclase (GGDEF)-like protein